MQDNSLEPSEKVSAGRGGEPRRERWLMPGVVFAALMLVLIGGYWETLESMASVWWRSDTFTHGLLVFPVTAYLIWTRREALAAQVPRPGWLALPVLAFLGGLWLLARMADVLVVQQLAFIAMIPTIVCLVLGARVAASIAYPLAFLIFAVPMGEGLIPPLMDFTASFTVTMLQLVGVPVVQEGTFIEVPTGQWSVVEACSGFRYLLASMTLGALYAYVTYRSYWRRAAFILLSFVVPVFANGMRAFMIVMIGHLSGMKLAVGVDHLIYGWIWFGVVMFVMFWLGARFREDDRPQADVAPSPLPRVTPAGIYLAATLGTIALVAWPALTHLRLSQPAPALVSGQSIAPIPQGEWQPSDRALADWGPTYVGADQRVAQTYVKGQERVALYLAHYDYQRPNAELINSRNVLVQEHDQVWSRAGSDVRTLEVNGSKLQVRRILLRSEGQRLVVYAWSRIGSQYFVNDYVGKWLEAKSTLMGGDGSGTGIIVAAQYTDDPVAADEALRRFLVDMLPAVERQLAGSTRVKQ